VYSAPSSSESGGLASACLSCWRAASRCWPGPPSRAAAAGAAHARRRGPRPGRICLPPPPGHAGGRPGRAPLAPRTARRAARRPRPPAAPRQQAAQPPPGPRSRPPPVPRRHPPGPCPEATAAGQCARSRPRRPTCRPPSPPGRSADAGQPNGRAPTSRAWQAGYGPSRWPGPPEPTSRGPRSAPHLRRSPARNPWHRPAPWPLPASARRWQGHPPPDRACQPRAAAHWHARCLPSARPGRPQARTRHRAGQGAPPPPPRAPGRRASLAPGAATQQGRPRGSGHAGTGTRCASPRSAGARYQRAAPS
jgi:hypothetical protein